MNANSENPKIGRFFEELVASLLSKYYDKAFRNEVAIPIVISRVQR